MTNEHDVSLDEIRELIDEADSLLLLTLGKRFKAIDFMRRLKSLQKLPIADPKREQVLRDTWKKRAQEAGVPEPLALLILDLILTESKRLQSA